MFLKYHKIAMVGEGVTGLSVHKALQDHDCKVDLMSIKSKHEWRDLVTKASNGNYDLIVVSPGIPDNSHLNEIRDAGVRIMSDIELFSYMSDTPIIAITGTNGKTTCACWLQRLLDSKYHTITVGNIGKPIFDILDDADTYDFIILEISSFQLHYTSQLPVRLACLLNLSTDHLDWHTSLDHYHQSKWRIGDCADDAICHEALSHGESWLRFGYETQSADITKLIDSTKWDRLTETDRLNALAVFAMAHRISDDFSLDDVIAKAPKLPHRMEILNLDDDWVWVNDSKATNFAAVRVCLESTRQSYPDHLIIWLTGGVFKEAVPKNIHSIASHIMSFGQDGNLVSENYYARLSLLLPELYKLKHDYYKKPVVVCFSPGGASFDEFKSYSHRGDFFSSWVKEVIVNEAV